MLQHLHQLRELLQPMRPGQVTAGVLMLKVL
jgi:hypothetical protein